MEPSEAAHWRKCSVCKKPIGFKSRYYTCSVSTCSGARTGYVFCSIQCFETHLPGARHRDAGAIEKLSPSQAEAAAQEGAILSSASTSSPSVTSVAAPKRVFVSAPASSVSTPSRTPVPRETLVVVSKVKDYIRARSEMNTSDGVMAILSDRIRELCDEAIETARQDGRKTVLERDLKRKS
jgi:hypothetical protein